MHVNGIGMRRWLTGFRGRQFFRKGSSGQVEEMGGHVGPGSETLAGAVWFHPGRCRVGREIESKKEKIPAF